MQSPSSPYPPFNPPPGPAAHLSIINTTTSISSLGTHYLMKPPMPGLSVLPTLPAWSFLIESPTPDHSTGKPRRALYDLGVPPDWQDTEKGGFPPVTIKRLKDNGWDVRAERGVAEVLEQEGVERGSVGSIVWSHWHWDHIGDPSTFPSTTEVVVGPGFKEEFSPYYPEKQDSPIKASYFKDRQLREITFPPGPDSLHIGPFPAHDFFGDGSFYLLDTPGHAIGHLGGLVRTTSSPSSPNGDTFVFLGGDLCHHAGELRPSPYLPIPTSIILSPKSSLSLLRKYHSGICPGADLQHLQTQRGRSVDQPFFEPAMGASIPQAIETIEKTWLADAREDVLFIFAHDAKVEGVVDFFPKRMNVWKERGWRDMVLWRFVEDFEGALGKGEAREGRI